MKNILRAAVAAMITCGVVSAEAQTLRVGLQSDIDTFDPVQSNNIAARSVFTALCDKLIDVDETLALRGQLATSWSWSADRRSLTLTLRDGVVFHDGTPFDAEAVKANLERALTLPGSRRRSEIGAITAVVPEDRLRVRIDLSAPFAPLLAQFTDRAGMMMSPRGFATAATAPVCSGPFAFAERVAASDVAAIRAERGLRLVELTGLGFTSIIVNVGNGERARTPLGQDPRLREAFDLAIDRETLNRVAFEGTNRAGNQPVPPDSPYFHKGFPLRGADIARAKALLAAAGQPALAVRMLVPNTTEFRAMAEILQAMVAEAGIRLEIEMAELATAAAMMNKGDFQAFLIGWSGRLDPDGNIYGFNHCKGANNDSRFCDPRVDAALDRARASLAEDERRAAYDEAAAIHLPARHRLYLVHENWRFAHGARLRGFRPVADGVIRFQGLALE
jgi:peptide/nickel transport system substrate-binding protein